MVPLTWLDLGETSVIECIRANPKVGRHLCSLGLAVGEPVTVMQRNGENVIIAIRDCRLALDEKLALKVMVNDGYTQKVACGRCMNDCDCDSQPQRGRRRRKRGFRGLRNEDDPSL